MSDPLKKIIKQCKSQAKEICLLVLGGAFNCKSCQFEKLHLFYGTATAALIDLILENLLALESNVDLTARVKQQIASIEGKLKVFGMFAWIITEPSTLWMIMRAIISHTQSWANHVSCLACLYWIDEMEESLASGTILSDLMQKHMPHTPRVVAMYLCVLMSTRHLNLHGKITPQLFVCYVDFLIERLVIFTKDDTEILREALIFLLSFGMDPPKVDSEEKKLIVAESYAIIRQVPSVICIAETMLSDFQTMLSDFLHKVDGIKVKVRDVYVLSPLSSQSNSSRTNVIGFLDSFLGKLEKILEGKMNFIPSVKDHIRIVKEELASLKPFLQVKLELENEHEELENLWIQIVNVVYFAAYVTNLCSTTSFLVWYGIICLPNVIEDIKLIRSKVKKIEDDQTYGKKKFSVEMESSNAMLMQATTSKDEGAFIGFMEDLESISNHLVGGEKDLKIISISGMPGQGKTTLARKLFNNSSIQSHFNGNMWWCYVSRGCKTSYLLANILYNVCKEQVDVNQGIHDLADRLRKSLKGKRYLIVFDDIWDVDVWCQVQVSFPDDKKGSRILFTSRNHDLASQAKPNSISHPLPLFSDEESWKLMKDKLSICEDFPSEFLKIGKQIAVCCKGLPLAVAVIASLLKRIAQKLDLWKEVAENLKSHLASEGCMHIIELSYKYLPHHLKPCFLYFGAFPRGQNIGARKLKLLWIAEGFVKENECSEDLAKEYLDNLVSQNLVVVTERSSTGGIKSCNVHDLLYDLCLEKAVEDNFLHLAERSTIVDEYCSNPQKYNFHHRLCIGESDSFTQPRPICTRKELPTSQIHSLLWFNGYSGIPSYESLSCFFSNFRVLTVLDLENLNLNNYSRFPEVIFCNIHLTYLAVRGSFGIIPSSIVDLWNLKTLFLRPYKVDYIPHTLWEMKSLRWVDINQSVLFLKGFGENESSTSTCNIKTLRGIILCYDRETEELLRRLSRLRELKCYFKEFWFCPMWFSMFGSLEKLESLWIGRIGDERCLFPNQQQLPTINFPDNLKKLTLSELRLPWSAMSTIGKLPNLGVLKLCYGACQGITWDLVDGEFSKLRYLKLCAIVNLERINDSDCYDPFPCLEKLFLIYCWRLEEIPLSFGRISTLDIIDVSNSPKASNSARRILEEGGHMGNNNLQILGLDNDDDDDNNDYDDEKEKEENDDNDDSDEEEEVAEDDHNNNSDKK